MPTATGLTAERIALIEAQQIVDAHIDVNNLILVRGDDSEIDVGSVRGIQGEPGIGLTELQRGTWTPTWTGLSPGSGVGFVNSGTYQFIGSPLAAGYGFINIGVQMRFGATSPVFPSGTDVTFSMPAGFLLQGGPSAFAETSQIGHCMFIPDGIFGNGVLGGAFRFDSDQVELNVTNWTTGLVSNPTATSPITFSATGGSEIINVQIQSAWCQRTP